MSELHLHYNAVPFPPSLFRLIQNYTPFPNRLVRGENEKHCCESPHSGFILKDPTKEQVQPQFSVEPGTGKEMSTEVKCHPVWSLGAASCWVKYANPCTVDSNPRLVTTTHSRIFNSSVVCKRKRLTYLTISQMGGRHAEPQECVQSHMDFTRSKSTISSMYTRAQGTKDTTLELPVIS